MITRGCDWRQGTPHSLGDWEATRRSVTGHWKRSWPTGPVCNRVVYPKRWFDGSALAAKTTAACQTERGDGFPERRDSAIKRMG